MGKGKKVLSRKKEVGKEVDDKGAMGEDKLSPPLFGEVDKGWVWRSGGLGFDSPTPLNSGKLAATEQLRRHA